MMMKYNVIRDGYVFVYNINIVFCVRNTLSNFTVK